MKKTALLTALLLFVTLTPTVLAETSTLGRSSTPPGLLKKAETKPITTKTTGADKKSEKSMDIKTRIATPVGTLKDRNRHIIGKITALGSNSFTLLANNNAAINVTVDSNTKYFDWQGPKKAITFASLKVGNRLSVVGIAPGESSGVAVIIYRLVEPERHAAYFGTITKIDIASSSATGSANLLGKKTKPATASAVLATITLRLRIGTSAAVLITRDTKFKITGLKNALLSDLKIGQKVVTTGILDTLNNLIAKNFIVIANGRITDNNSSASGSAHPASNSAKTNH